MRERERGGHQYRAATEESVSKLSEIKQETEEREGKGVTLVIGRDTSRGRRIKGEREGGRERERESK